MGLTPTQETAMQEIWTKPEVTEQEVGLEVTSYVAAEIKDV
jgi:coenzyme PQQ precursor peptide PqqA